MRRRNHNRLLGDSDKDNPLAMLANLFDVAMVFAVALMVAFVSHFNMSEIFSEDDFTIVKKPSTSQMEVITKKNGNLTKMSAAENNEDNSSRGQRVGTAYRLDNGDIIYIPD